MRNAATDLYDPLAPYYHLLFEDWDASIARQGAMLHSLLTPWLGAAPVRILDCACGIGTQAIGLARHGHRVVGSDLSAPAVKRAAREAKSRGLDVSFYVSDMTSLQEIIDTDFDVVAALDNALPHLTAAQLQAAAGAMHSKLRPGGLFLASIRDYDALIRDRPTFQGPAFYGEEGQRRIVHQVWEWTGAARYRFHVYITLQQGKTWDAHHFVSEYRCLLREELSATLASAGFEGIRWLMPAESGYYQPIVVARRRL